MTRTLAITHRLAGHEHTHSLVLPGEVRAVRVRLAANVNGQRQKLRTRIPLVGQRDVVLVHDQAPAGADVAAFTLEHIDLAWHGGSDWEPADPAKLTQEPVR